MILCGVDVLILVLRLLHIVSGAFWVGSIVMAVLFIEPTAKALGASGERFLAHAIFRTGLAPILVGAATLAIGTGAALYWIVSGGLRIEWITSSTGLGFTAGALAALAAYAIALIVLGPQFDRLAALLDTPPASEVEAPSPDGKSKLNEARLRRWSLIEVSLLLFALAAMATARYLR